MKRIIGLRFQRQDLPGDDEETSKANSPKSRPNSANPSSPKRTSFSPADLGEKTTPSAKRSASVTIIPTETVREIFVFESSTPDIQPKKETFRPTNPKIQPDKDDNIQTSTGAAVEEDKEDEGEMKEGGMSFYGLMDREIQNQNPKMRQVSPEINERWQESLNFVEEKEELEQQPSEPVKGRKSVRFDIDENEGGKDLTKDD